MKIIVLSGKMRAGKSFIADHLINQYAYERISLAEPLKKDISDMGFTDNDIAEKPPWMRQLMIAYGQARRAVLPTYWIDRAFAQIIRRSERGINLFVCDDCRFENELEAFKNLKELGHEVVCARVSRIGGPEGLDDQSETELDKHAGWDARIQAMSGDTAGLIENALVELKFFRKYDEQLDLFRATFFPPEE